MGNKTMPSKPTNAKRLESLETRLASLETGMTQLLEALTEPKTEKTKVSKTVTSTKGKHPNSIAQAAYWDGKKKSFVLIPYVKGSGPKSSKTLIANHKDTSKGGVLMTRVNGSTFMAKRSTGEKTVMTADMHNALSS